MIEVELQKPLRLAGQSHRAREGELRSARETVPERHFADVMPSHQLTRRCHQPSIAKLICDGPFGRIGVPASILVHALTLQGDLDAMFVHEAHHFHRLTAAHCRATESMQRAVEAGIDLMEHAEFLDPDGPLRFDPQLAEMMAETGIWISPTLQAWCRWPQVSQLRARRDDGDATDAEILELEALEARAQGRLDLMRRMLDVCGKERIVPGTDSGVNDLAFGHLDYDLQLLVEVGFTPGEALEAATRISAEAVGLDDELGTITPGKAADLVAFDGDPTRDVAAVSRVVAVFQAGHRVR